MTIRIAANLGFMFTETSSLIKRYEAASKAGFVAVECPNPYSCSVEEISTTLKTFDLRQVLINTLTGKSDSCSTGFASLPGMEEDFCSSLETSIKYAKTLGTQKIHIMSGQSLGEENREKQIRAMECNLERAVKILEEENITGLIEPINLYSIPGYFLSDYSTAISLIKKINSPYLRLQLDLFHLQMIMGNITNNIKQLLPITGHIQLAQSPNRNEPSFPGELNYEYIFSLLKLEGYNGFIGAEYQPSGNTVDSLNWIHDYGLSF